MSNKYDIVNDASKFLKLSSDPTLRREGNLQRFLSTLKNKYFFTKEQCDNIYAFDSQPARIHSIPKKHTLKSSADILTFRPIVSSIGTYNYNLTKFLTDMLGPVIQQNIMQKTHFHFARKYKR